MYIILYICFFLIILLITKKRFNTIIKSNILFTGMWCICAGISSLGLYGLFKPSGLIHFYSLTAIITFNTAFLLHNKKITGVLNIKQHARLKLIYTAHILCWVYSFGFLLKSLDIISLYGFKVLRSYDSSMGLATTLELTIFQWIVQPVFVATILIAAVYMVLGRKNRTLTLIALTDLIIYTLLFGGRYMLVRTMMYYIFTFLILKSSRLEQLKKKKINIIYIGVIIGAIIILTNLRNWVDTSFIENTLIYYTGSFSFLLI